MKQIFIIVLAICLSAVSVSAADVMVSEPFNSGGLAYAWSDLRSVTDYLPQVVTDSSVGLTDQDSDGYLGAMPQPAGSTINIYYVPSLSDAIADGTVTAWVYVQQITSTTDTVYAGVVGRSELIIDPSATYMYRTIWRTNTTTIRCQSYSTAGWHTVADTALITTEGWHQLTLSLHGTQVDGYDGTDHFASEANDTTTVAGDLGTLWGLYAFTSLDDWLYCDDVQIIESASPVDRWHLY